jgi:enterochelin esterase family protein
MKHVSCLFVVIACVSSARAQDVKRNIPYTEKGDERQVLDVYSPANARDLPVVFWIHGGGWQAGDKTEVQVKPLAFMDEGFVFVSTNYRLLPSVDMATIVRDVARSIHWVHDHIAEYGGDPDRLLIMGHSAGAQLAALICTDDRYLKAEGLSLAITKACVPVDGDTYDVPAIIETAETRWRVHGLPPAKFGHREKFGNDPAKHRDFSAVTHVAKDKGIPPFLILYVAEHPDTTAQALRLGNVLKDAGLPVTLYGARETTHSKINADLGKPDDPATQKLFDFLEKVLSKERDGRSVTPAAPNPDSQYRLGPDSLPQEGVPKGEIRGPYTLPSTVYPGTQHTYWVYVPLQYDPATPAALMVFQDGQAFKDEKGDMRAQNVMDNLIYRREIPVMIGVFINPGRRPDQPEPTPRNWGDRDTNRPTEYNSLDDKYARVITEELMPALAKEYNISTDPEMHGIGGSSSGAIAAFTVAWERPDQFRKVLSNVGSFVNLRGGHVYPERVLASEKKPIRVFLCDGRNDNRGGRRRGYDEKMDWFYQNVRLMKALTQKGYDVNYSWGMNQHGQKFGGAVLPEMMRWLWRDGPASTDPNDTAERSFRQPAKKKE